jgi:hypothetical protein
MTTRRAWRPRSRARALPRPRESPQFEVPSGFDEGILPAQAGKAGEIRIRRANL